MRSAEIREVLAAPGPGLAGARRRGRTGAPPGLGRGPLFLRRLAELGHRWPSSTARAAGGVAVAAAATAWLAARAVLDGQR